MAKKINLDDVEKWKEMRSRGYSFNEISKQFYTSPKTISKYLRQETEVPFNDTSISPTKSKDISSNHDSGLISDITSGPDIIKLQKKLEITKLKRQIREAEAPIELEKRFEELEQRINEWMERIDNTIAIELENYKCQCGAEGNIAFFIICTKCNKKSWYGKIGKIVTD